MPLCCKCNKKVIEGFHAAGKYYCGADCLEKDYTSEEWDALYKEDSDEFYWSVFED